jgi:hypothetical protein
MPTQQQWMPRSLPTVKCYLLHSTFLQQLQYSHKLIWTTKFLRWFPQFPTKTKQKNKDCLQILTFRTTSTGARGKSVGSAAASWKPTIQARGLQPNHQPPALSSVPELLRHHSGWRHCLP